MTAKPSPTAQSDDPALRALLQAIAARDRPATSRLLAMSPRLARLAITVGATRHAASEHYLAEIAHHGADTRRKNGSGSTPLHLAIQSTGRGSSGSQAARAEQAEIIRLLLGRGARPSDQNLAGRSVEDCVKAGWIRTLLQEA